VGNFQGTYLRLGTFWDLKNYRQKPRETLHEYIYHFSKQCNELPDIVNADVIEVFISGTTNESLVHKLGHNNPRTTRELLNLATNMPLERRPFEPTLVETRARPLPSWRVALGTVTSKERV
jgi:hypothetical protein